MIPSPLSAPAAPTQPSLADTTRSSTLGKEEFLKLLVAQLRNQDPMSPTKPEAMAAQLAQFSSLEQLINVNERLMEQTQADAVMAAALNNSAALSVLGKTVLAAGDSVEITGAGDETITVGVGSIGGSATLTLYDSDGQEVGSRIIGSVGGGRQEISVGEIASNLAPGRYRYELTVTDASGESVEVETLTVASIDGVRYGLGGPFLVSGDLEIPLATVVEIIAQQGLSQQGSNTP